MPVARVTLRLSMVQITVEDLRIMCSGTDVEGRALQTDFWRTSIRAAL